jgi:hypothetical protein
MWRQSPSTLTLRNPSICCIAFTCVPVEIESMPAFQYAEHIFCSYSRHAPMLWTIERFCWTYIGVAGRTEGLCPGLANKLEVARPLPGGGGSSTAPKHNRLRDTGGLYNLLRGNYCVAVMQGRCFCLFREVSCFLFYHSVRKSIKPDL